MTQTQTLSRKPPPLPATVVDFMKQRKVMTTRTLNDQVEELHLRLYESNETYKRYLDAVWDEDAVEGSLACDNTLASEIIRDLSQKSGNREVGSKKLATISKALGVVLRRYGQSRKERRNMVGGEIVPGDNGD